MLRFWGVHQGPSVQILFLHLGLLEGRPFIALGGEVCRILLSTKGLAVLHSYTSWDEGIRIGEIPGLMVVLGWMCISQVVWLIEGRFLWSLILLGFMLWWGAEAFIPQEEE